MTLKNYFFKLIMHLVEMHTNKRISRRKLIDIFQPLDIFCKRSWFWGQIWIRSFKNSACCFKKCIFWLCEFWHRSVRWIPPFRTNVVPESSRRSEWDGDTDRFCRQDFGLWVLREVFGSVGTADRGSRLKGYCWEERQKRARSCTYLHLQWLVQKLCAEVVMFIYISE